MSDDNATVIGIIVALVVIVIIVGVAVVGAGFFLLTAKVQVNHVGIRVNGWSGVPNLDQTWDAGIYRWNFLGDYFIQFPLFAQSITFRNDSTVPTRTSDGLLAKVDAFIQYSYQKTRILDYYQAQGTSTDIIWRTAREAVYNEISKVSAIELYTNRVLVTGNIRTLITAEFDKLGLNFISFTLNSIDLPDAFEKAIEDKQVAEQNIERAMNEQEVARIEAMTGIIQAQARANITLVEAQAEATRIIAIADSMNLTSSELLLYLYIQAILTHDEAYLIIDASDLQLLIGLELEPSNATLGG